MGNIFYITIKKLNYSLYWMLVSTVILKCILTQDYMPSFSRITTGLWGVCLHVGLHVFILCFICISFFVCFQLRAIFQVGCMGIGVSLFTESLVDVHRVRSSVEVINLYISYRDTLIFKTEFWKYSISLSLWDICAMLMSTY